MSWPDSPARGDEMSKCATSGELAFVSFALGVLIVLAVQIIIVAIKQKKSDKD